ncbi:microneme protein mic4 [Cystoisospora suis]|uniref:Microneme protein mic4 n=1 Tax=Cystoisospora suis TaxID=483139 RepID=A0A2C6KJE6_9APIC|nr:microneme protein mic4 [Cystoisospora suis]
MKRHYISVFLSYFTTLSFLLLSVDNSTVYGFRARRLESLSGQPAGDRTWRRETDDGGMRSARKQEDSVGNHDSSLSGPADHSSFVTVSEERCFWPDMKSESSLLRQGVIDDSSLYQRLAGCQRWCLDTSECTHATYDRSTKFCYLRTGYSPRLSSSDGLFTFTKECAIPDDSDLYSSVSGEQSSSGDDDLIEQLVSQLGDCFRPKDTGSWSSNIKEQAIYEGDSPLLSMKACQDVCRSTEGCTHFTYDSDSKVCYVKEGTPNWEDRQNGMSATRDCGGDLGSLLGSASSSEGSEENSSESEEQCMYTLTTSENPKIISGVRKEGLGSCYSWCREKPNCTHFTYTEDTRMCELRSGEKVTFSPSRKKTLIMRGCRVPGVEDSGELSKAPECEKKDIGSTTAELKVVDASSFEICQDLCFGTDECTHVTFNSDSKKCFIKGGNPQWREYKNDFSFTVECYARASCFIARVGSLASMITHETRQSTKDCQDLCKSLSDCTHFTYNRSTKLCFVKSGQPNWRVYHDDMSATRDCELPQ